MTELYTPGEVLFVDSRLFQNFNDCVKKARKSTKNSVRHHQNYKFFKDFF